MSPSDVGSMDNKSGKMNMNPMRRIMDKFHPGKLFTSSRTGSCVLFVVVAMAVIGILIPTSFAMMPRETGVYSVGTTSATSAYVVAFDEMAPADALAAHASLAELVQANGGKVLYTFSLIDAVAVTFPEDSAYKLASFPGVDYIQKDHPVRLSMDQAVIQAGVKQYWDNSGTGGQFPALDGSGIVVCVIDSGIDNDHPDLAGKVLYEHDFTSFSDIAQQTVALDANGHGTFVASEIAGIGVSSSLNGDKITPGIQLNTIPGNENEPDNVMRGPFKGIAPGASLIDFKISGATTETSALVVEQAVDCAANSNLWNDNNPAGLFPRPDIISMSLNSGVPDRVLTRTVEEAVALGIVVVVSAGNTGPIGQVEAPGDAPGVITVGSANRDDTVSFFSCHGPTLSGLMKPDILAPGQDIIAAKQVTPNGLQDGPATNFQKYYMVESGTSMATPMVTGIVALMLDRDPTLSPAEVKALLIENAEHPANSPQQWDMYFGNGVVNAYNTLVSLDGGNIPSVPASPVATVSFDKATYTVNENEDSLDVYVDVTWGTGASEITVTYEALSGSGTAGAMQGVDYALSTGTLTFTKGQATRQHFTIQILDNGVATEDKAFNLKLSSTDNVRIAEPTSTVTILDSDYTAVRFARNSYTVTNDAGSFKVMLEVQRSPNAGTGDISVDVSLDDGSAVLGNDFRFTDAANTVRRETVHFQGGAAVPVEITVNSPTQNTQYFTLRLSNAVNARITSPSAITVWVVAVGSGDMEAPTTPAPTVTSSIPPNTNDWYTSDVTVKIDASASSDVDHIWYNLGDGRDVKVSGNKVDVVITKEGSTTVNYWAVDKEGNAEDVQTVGPINIDKADPVITYLSRTPTDTTWITGPVTMTFSVFDACSGVDGPTTITKTVPSPTPGDWNNLPVEVSASDVAGHTTTLTVTDDIRVDMTPPTIGTITTPAAPVAVNTDISVSCPVSDAASGLANVKWTWGDGTTTDATIANGQATGTHKYASASVYTVKITATDNVGNSASAESSFVVVYDPSAGFVTGGGWINSPINTSYQYMQQAGKANFGFVSKYTKGATIPTGNTEFDFKMGGLNFKSTSYEWLVISGSKATYKGTGKINGLGSYKFMLVAVDGSPDKFRIKIWDPVTNVAVYDNLQGSADTATPNAIEGGSIVIHK